MTTDSGKSGRCDAVIVAYGDCGPLVDCIASLASQTDAGLRKIILVDNNPEGSQCDAARLQSEIDGRSTTTSPRSPILSDLSLDILAAGENLGYGRAVNAGLERVEAEYVLVANPDLVIEPGALRLLIAALQERSRAGAAGPTLRTSDGERTADTPLSLPRISSEILGFIGLRPRSRSLDDGDVLRVEFLSGACFVARRIALREVGGFDPAFFLYYEDADLFRRLSHGGWELIHVPGARVRHAHGGTWSDPVKRQAAAFRGALTYYGKHGGVGATLLLRLGLIFLYLPRLVLGGAAEKLLGIRTGMSGGGHRARMIREVVRIARSR